MGYKKATKQRKPCTLGILAFHSYQWPLQVPKLEVLYHIKPYFGNLSPLHSPYIDLIYGSWNGHCFISEYYLNLGTQKNGLCIHQYDRIIQDISSPAESRHEHGKATYGHLWHCLFWPAAFRARGLRDTLAASASSNYVVTWSTPSLAAFLSLNMWGMRYYDGK